VVHVKIIIIALALCHMHISNVAKLPGFTQLDYTNIRRLQRSGVRLLQLLEYNYIGFRLLNNVDYSARLVLTEKLVESDYHAINNNRHGSTADRHGFADTRPRIKLSHLFQ
jgi:hypothetical protein